MDTAEEERPAQHRRDYTAPFCCPTARLSWWLLAPQPPACCASIARRRLWRRRGMGGQPGGRGKKSGRGRGKLGSSSSRRGGERQRPARLAASYSPSDRNRARAGPSRVAVRVGPSGQGVPSVRLRAALRVKAGSRRSHGGESCLSRRNGRVDWPTGVTPPRPLAQCAKGPRAGTPPRAGAGARRAQGLRRPGGGGPPSPGYVRCAEAGAGQRMRAGSAAVRTGAAGHGGTATPAGGPTRSCGGAGGRRVGEGPAGSSLGRRRESNPREPAHGARQGTEGAGSTLHAGPQPQAAAAAGRHYRLRLRLRLPQSFALEAETAVAAPQLRGARHHSCACRTRHGCSCKRSCSCSSCCRRSDGGRNRTRDAPHRRPVVCPQLGCSINRRV